MQTIELSVSELGFAVKISGSDMNALETSFRFLARRMDETRTGTGVAIEQFKKLGISVTDAQGAMRPSVDVMLEVADGIANLTSESEKVATAMDIFGGSMTTAIVAHKHGRKFKMIELSGSETWIYCLEEDLDVHNIENLINYMTAELKNSIRAKRVFLAVKSFSYLANGLIQKYKSVFAETKIFVWQPIFFYS